MVAASIIPAMLAAEELSFSYPGRPVFDALSFAAELGARTAIIGPNGSGKSTLLRALAGLLVPSAGFATLAGKSVHSMSASARARHLAYVPHSTSLAFPFSVRGYVSFGRYALGSAQLASDVERALAAVDLLDRADDSIGELSQGQRQRAAIARALCQIDGMPEAGPRFVLADEPTASLDPSHHLGVLGLVGDLASRGIGMVVVLHDISAAASFDRAVLLGPGGRMVAQGPGSDVVVPSKLSEAFGVEFEILLDADGSARAIVPVAQGT